MNLFELGVHRVDSILSDPSLAPGYISRRLVNTSYRTTYLLMAATARLRPLMCDVNVTFSFAISPPSFVHKTFFQFLRNSSFHRLSPFCLVNFVSRSIYLFTKASRWDSVL